MEKQISFIVSGFRHDWMIHLREGNPTFPAMALFLRFGGTRVEPYHLYVKTSQLMSNQGIDTLPLDFRSSGESEGNFRDMTLGGEIQAARGSLTFLKSIAQVDPFRSGVPRLYMEGFGVPLLRRNTLLSKY